MKKKVQVSDHLLTAVLLAMVGGFLDAYTYICRGGVFANAQTGNMVLFGIMLSKGQVTKAVYYLVPILSFVVGIILANLIKIKYQNKEQFHWRQIIIVLEFVVIIIVANIPQGAYNFIANILVSFVCSLQVESFRKVNGYAYASTMCTGNLRSATERILNYVKTKDKAELKAGVQYYGIILFFVAGGAIGAVVTEKFSIRAVYVTAVGLLAVLIMMFKKSDE